MQSRRSVFQRAGLKSRNCTGNCNCQFNTSKEKMHLKTNRGENMLNMGDVGKRISFSCWTDWNYPEMASFRQKREAESKLRRGALRLSSEWGRIRERRGLVQRGGWT